MHRVCSIVGFLLLGLNLFSQEFGKQKIEAAYLPGSILKHSEEFITDVSGFSQAFELGLSFRTFGNKPWQYKAKYPEFGVVLHHARFANQEVLGQAWGLMPTVRFTFVRHSIFDFYLRTGAGLAWLNKPYNRRTNPTNNIIGSKLNAIIQIRLGLDWHLAKGIDLITGFSFTHYSNSRSQSPNLGINMATATVGLSVAPFVQKAVYEKPDITKPKKRNEFIYRFSMAVNDQQPGGPKAPVYLNTLAYARKTSIINKVLVGTTLAYDRGEHNFLLFNEPSIDGTEARRSMDWSVFIADEILLGKLGIQFLIGAYLINPTLQVEPIYAKVGANYYFYSFGPYKTKQFFAGINLKSHYSVAQFLEFGVGVTL